MGYGKFVLVGEDKKSLSMIKNTLTANGLIYVGYTQETHNVLRIIRKFSPELVIIDVMNKFNELKPFLEAIDEDVLAACILLLETRNDNVIEFLRNTRIMSYLTKPVFDDAAMQVVDISTMNFERVLEYESKVRKLNDTLESRKVVEKAKWLLVEKEGFTEPEAYEVIKRKSRDNRMPMKEIAEAIILTRG